MHNLPTAVYNTIGATPFTMQIDMLRPSLAFFKIWRYLQKDTLAAVSWVEKARYLK